MTGRGKLQEGKRYHFLYLKDTIVGDERFMVLQSPAGSRHLIPAAPYQSWEFSIGKELVCRVDKVNCKNEIFLEPEHPLYRVGKVYSFTLIGKTQELQADGKWKTRLWIEDQLGVQHQIPDAYKVKARSGRLRLKIDRIKKGVFYFSPAEETEN